MSSASAGGRRRRAAPAAVPEMPAHLHPAALTASVVVDGAGTVRLMLAATSASHLRAALLADAAERARLAQQQTTSPARAVRRILDGGS